MTNHLTPRRILSLIFVIATIAGLAACGVGGSTSLTVNDIISKADAAHFKDATFTLSLAIKGTFSGTSINTTFTGGGTATSNPQRSDIKFSGSVLGQTVSEETITDGDTTYSKSSGDSKWTKSTSSNSGAIPAPDSSSLFGELKNPKLVGIEQINGHATYHISGTAALGTATPTTSSTSTNATADVWVRTDNFYPAKATFQASGSDFGVDNGSAIVEIDFTKWDSGVTITVPSPDQVQGS